MTFKPGEVSNPNGRPVGSRNKRTEKIFEVLEARGDKDPVDALSEIVTTTTDPYLKAQAANMLAPYKHSKRSTAPTPRYIEEPVVVPQFTSIEQAEEYLASLPVLLGKGELDSQTALELSQLIRNWISAKFDHEELQLKIAQHGGYGETRITVTGGLPTLPGCENMILPQINGNRHEIDAIPALAEPQTESPAQQEAQDADQGSS
jgi:hypothetical protein